MARTKRKNRTKDDWTTLFTAFNASELTQTAFCKRHGINYHSFRHRDQSSPQFVVKRRQAPKEAFAEMEIPSRSSASSSGLVMHVGERVRIECPSDISLESIAAVARGLTHDA